MRFRPFVGSGMAVLAILGGGGTAVHAHVTLNSPNGGEVFDFNSPIVIEWEIDIPHNQQNWDLWYSTESSGGDWVEIMMDLAPGDTASGSVHSFEWTVPGVIADDVWVRVRMDNAGTDYYDVSNASFSIVPAPGVLSLSLVAPMLSMRRRSRGSSDQV